MICYAVLIHQSLEWSKLLDICYPTQDDAEAVVRELNADAVRRSMSNLKLSELLKVTEETVEVLTPEDINESIKELGDERLGHLADEADRLAVVQKLVLWKEGT